MNGLIQRLARPDIVKTIIRNAGRLIPRHCLFCLEKTHSDSELCPHCIKVLYLNNHCCQRCAVPMEAVLIQPISLCGNCLSHRYHYDQVYSPYQYSEEIAYLIKKLKYQKKIHYASVLADLFIQKTVDLASFQLPQALIPIPMHPKRLKQRGFNQALEISRALSSFFQLPHNYTDLIRHRYTHLQADLSAAKRQKNVRKAFHLKTAIAYEHVALVDDVMTTGSTVNEAAKLLKKQGIKQVDVWTIARAGLRN